MNFSIIILAIFIGVMAVSFSKSSKIRIISYSVGLALVIVSQSFTVIPTGNTGVKTTFGQINSATLPNGFNAKIPGIQSIKKVNNKQQDITFKDKIWSVTAENTNVYVEDVVVTYQISPEKSAWIYANVTNYKDNLISSVIVQSAIKASSVTLNTDQIPNRGLFEPIAKEALQKALDEKYSINTVIVIAVNIGNVDFEEGYNQALEQKQLTQKQMETAQIENRTAVEKAEATAKAKLIEAQAEAESKLLKARAEAEANELLATKLTDAILRDKYIAKWNGQLPTYSGDGANVYIPFGN